MSASCLGSPRRSASSTARRLCTSASSRRPMLPKDAPAWRCDEELAERVGVERRRLLGAPGGLLGPARHVQVDRQGERQHGARLTRALGLRLQALLERRARPGIVAGRRELPGAVDVPGRVAASLPRPPPPGRHRRAGAAPRPPRPARAIPGRSPTGCGPRPGTCPAARHGGRSRIPARPPPRGAPPHAPAASGRAARGPAWTSPRSEGVATTNWRNRRSRGLFVAFRRASSHGQDEEIEEMHRRHGEEDRPHRAEGAAEEGPGESVPHGRIVLPRPAGDSELIFREDDPTGSSPAARFSS